MSEPIEEMVESQLKARGVDDPRVLAAMRKIKRNLFVPGEYRELAFEDHPVPIGQGQTISQPFIVAWMTQALDLTGKEKVLEIGTGSGYQTAILSELSKTVYTVERIEALSQNAEQLLKGLHYKNIFFKIGDGSEGWAENAPYDRILVTAAGGALPGPLFEQLGEKGKMLIPLGERFSQMLTMVEKVNGKKKITVLDSVVFVPLVGKYGMDKPS
jgi:protein-L-isoaspartate(D-aspartate) O-methyltransferase